MNVKIAYHDPSHAKGLYKALSHPDMTFVSKPPSVEKVKSNLEASVKQRENKEVYGYTIFYNDQAVGSCALLVAKYHSHVAYLAYYLNPDYWGKGIVPEALKLLIKEAFEKHGLVRLVADMETTNKKSERVAQKLNFNLEGIQKKYLERNGKYVDSFLYAYVKED